MWKNLTNEVIPSLMSRMKRRYWRRSIEDIRSNLTLSLWVIVCLKGMVRCRLSSLCGRWALRVAMRSGQIKCRRRINRPRILNNSWEKWGSIATCWSRIRGKITISIKQVSDKSNLKWMHRSTTKTLRALPLQIWTSTTVRAQSIRGAHSTCHQVEEQLTCWRTWVEISMK